MGDALLVEVLESCSNGEGPFVMLISILDLMKLGCLLTLTDIDFIGSLIAVVRG